MLKLAAYLLLGASVPASASPCTDMVGLPPLESASTAQKPMRVVIEAILHDAETIYTEGAHIVARKPRSNSEADTISRMEMLRVGGESFQIKECNFQSAFYPMMEGAEAKYSKDTAFTLERIGQFDNFIFQAVNEALACSNRQAEFDLSLSRQLLDHAWLEFKGRSEQRNWDPADLDGPKTHESWVDDR